MNDPRSLEDSRVMAERQAQTIRQYWLRRGYDVQPKLVLLDPNGDRSQWTVRVEGFINGCPPRSARLP